jgi:3-methyladenine DNA glycosylase AlkD
MNPLSLIIDDLNNLANPEKAKILQGFFKTGPGQYGEGDIFLGITVPNQRTVAKKYFKEIRFDEIQKLLQDKTHEIRLTAVIILVYKFEKTKSESEKTDIYELYMNNPDNINNWDLVDSSAPYISGPYLFEKDKAILYDWAKTNHLWKQRIAIMSTYYFIKQHSFEDALKISELLLEHEHDLIHKAVGWMLREIGNRNLDVELKFLDKYYKQMPRTMLRYAIEKFPEDLRLGYLKGFKGCVKLTS